MGGGDGRDVDLGSSDDLLVSTAIGLVVDAVGADFAIVAKTEVEKQTRGRAPVVFKVEAEHGWSKVEGRVARGAGGGLDGARGGEAVGVEGLVGQHCGCCREEVELGSGVVLEETAYLRFIDEIDAHAQGVFGKGVGEVVAELEFMLAGFLRDVDVRAEADAVREEEVRSAGV